MNDFEQYIQYRALAFKYETLKQDGLTRSIDQIIDKTPLDGLQTEDFKLPPLKNVCAKVSVELSDRLDDTTSTLGMSKRQFIEMALIQALDFADHMLECVGADEALDELAESRK